MVYQQPSKKPASDDTTYFSKSSQKEQQGSFGGNFDPNQSDERLNGQSLPEYSSRGWDLLKAKFARTRPKDGIQGTQESSEQPEAKLPLQTTEQQQESRQKNGTDLKSSQTKLVDDTTKDKHEQKLTTIKEPTKADIQNSPILKQQGASQTPYLIAQANQPELKAEVVHTLSVILSDNLISEFKEYQQNPQKQKYLENKLLTEILMQVFAASEKQVSDYIEHHYLHLEYYSGLTEKILKDRVFQFTISQNVYNDITSQIHRLSPEQVDQIGIPTINSSQSPYINRFIDLLKINIYKRLQNNLQFLTQEEEKYKNTQADNPHWPRLQKIIEQDQTLVKTEEQLNNEFDRLDLLSGQLSSFFDQDKIKEISLQKGQIVKQKEEIKQIRKILRSQYPALAVLNTGIIDVSTDNKVTLKQISDKFNLIRQTIADLEKRLGKNDLPLNKLTPVVKETKQQMGVSENAQDEKSKAISEWLKQEQAKEDIINIGGTVFGIALLIGTVFTDGLLSVFLGVSGAGVELGTAAYNLDIAGDLNAAAKASTVGKPLVEDPEEARLNYFLSWVNVFLAGLGLGGALRTGTSVIRGAQAAKRLVTMEGAEVLRRLNREQIAQFDQAIQLRRAGQADKAESILNQLRNEIKDDDVFNQANSLFERGRANAEIIEALGRGRKPYIRLDELGQRRNAVIAQCGEELVARAEANLRSLLDSGDVFIRIREPRLEALLQDGRYKTIIETGADAARQDPASDIARQISTRKYGEEKLFGYPQDLPSEYRPVYGYVAREADSPEAGIVGLGYGENIAIKAKPSVRSKVTFSGDDSLFTSPEGMTRQPSALDNPNIASFLSLEDIANISELQQKVQRIASAQNLNELTTIKQQHFYFEVQIHNQFTVNDIAEILYTDAQPSQSVTQLAKEKGITIIVR